MENPDNINGLLLDPKHNNMLPGLKRPILRWNIVTLMTKLRAVLDDRKSLVENSPVFFSLLQSPFLEGELQNVENVPLRFRRENQRIFNMFWA